MTVIWAVSLLRISPIYAVLFRRAPTHIAQKKSEIIPSGANRYTFSSVIFIRGVVWVVTSLTHRPPNFMFCGIMYAPAVFHRMGTSVLISIAATRFYTPLIKMPGANGFNRSAVAAAKPTTFSRIMNCQQHVAAAKRQILSWVCYYFCNHLCTPSTQVHRGGLLITSRSRTLPQRELLWEI